MRRLAKNLILATAVSAIFLVDISSVEAIHYEKIYPYEDSIKCLDFWSKFRDTVMPDPDEPQDNNPPKEDPPPAQNPKPAQPPKAENPKPAAPPRAVNPKPAE